jgi:hypothetical protein
MSPSLPGRGIPPTIVGMRRVSWRPLAAVVGLATMIAGAAVAQTDSARAVAHAGTIDGIVTDTTLRPLSGAIVSIAGSDVNVVTGTNGRFRIVKLGTGEYTLLVRRIGYESAGANVELAGAETVRSAFALQRIATALDTVRVMTRNASLTPKMADFYARKNAGQGQFMTQEQIEQRNSVEAVDLLRTFTSVLINDGVRGPQIVNFRSWCAYEVLVDGFPAPTNIDLPSPKEIAGIEVYTGPASVPLRFKQPGKSRCGLILIWLRDGSSGAP